MFSQSKFFYNNKMILLYYQSWPKVVWKVHGCWIDGYDSQNKDRNMPLRKIAKLCDSPPCYSCYLKCHLKYFTTLKNNDKMPVKFSRYRYSYCELDFRLNLALNGGHLGHYLHDFNLVNHSCECFILLVCIIRPLNID